MNKTKIEWCDYTLNLITGCLNHTNGLCKGGNFPCYAYKLAHERLKERYLASPYLPELFSMKGEHDPFYPRLWPDRFTVKGIPKGSRIFLNDMSDWVGIGIPEEWTRKVLDFIKANPDYIFLTLTKQPQNLLKFSPFPENCWVGVTITNQYMANDSVPSLMNTGAKFIYASIEPMLGKIDLTKIEFGTKYPNGQPKPWYIDSLQDHYIFEGEGDIELKKLDWLIIGSCTGTKTEMMRITCQAEKPNESSRVMPYGKKWTFQPKVEWVQEIVETADRAGIKVFLKDNLRPLLITDFTFPKPNGNNLLDSTGLGLRQESPKCHDQN